MMNVSQLLLVIIVLLCCWTVRDSLQNLNKSTEEAKSVTYDGIGTFTDKDFYDLLRRPLVFLPNSPEQINPTFLLYTWRTKHDPKLLIWKNVRNIRASPFDGSKRTKLIIHGFLTNINSSNWMKKMKDRLLDNGDFNVITVDWGNANGPPFNKAVANTRVLGPMIAILIQDLCRLTNTSPDKFHLIGHSLGAHAAGAAGKFLNGKLGRITGLDPAGPSYEGLPPEARLWRTDAKFVDAIHTDGKALFPFLGLGMYETCGHVDFYPNGGREQTGCNESTSSNDFIKDLIDGVKQFVLCNHQRSVDLYIASLENRQAKHKGYLCQDYQQYQDGKCQDCGRNGDKCAVFGLRSIEWKGANNNNDNLEGKRFFFNTGPESPFVIYKYTLSIKLSDKKKFELRGKINLKITNDDGKSKSIDFNKEKMIFKSGHQYSTTVVFNSTGLGKIARVDFKWSRGMDVIRSRMYVEQIRIYSMFAEFNKNYRRLRSTEKFCNPNVENGIQNSKTLSLMERC